MSKKVMISQPMAGLTDEQIVEARNKAIEFLQSKAYELDVIYEEE